MAKIPLILLAGLLCDKEVWENQINSLSSVAEIVIPDLSKATTPAAMMDAKLELVENSGHMVTMETPRVVTDLMRLWLM